MQDCLLEKLKGWEKVGGKLDNVLKWELFSLKGFFEWLAKWIAVDNQMN
jgi:hypothetical protein